MQDSTMLPEHTSISEESRWLLAFNSAAIAVIVALTYRATAMPMGLRAAGIFFLVGAIAAVVGWISNPSSSVEGQLKIAVFVSTIVFLLGVIISFFAV